MQKEPSGAAKPATPAAAPARANATPSAAPARANAMPSTSPARAAAPSPAPVRAPAAMPSLATAPKAKPEPEAAPEAKSLKTGGILAGVLAALVGAWLLWPAAPTDNLTPQQVQARVEHFQQAAASGLITMPKVDLDSPKAVEQAAVQIAAMPMKDEKAKAALAKELRAEAAKPAAQRTKEFEVVRFNDDCEIDGDTITVTAPGLLPTTLRLERDWQTLIIPKAKGQPTTITVYGSHDGYGGETVGLSTERGELPMPIFKQNQSIDFTIP
ncbi:hypothetical protein WV31_10335 [Magnetospirillum sp. ME-1]|uniref:hypothetical protein n=1 Tax=Magnetospirillum sp. ME-1 TaxID=1639348 RepID=UPI000A17A98D|nr:hypothetical protein [Magnetospirillum sp. ME-1]ARJ66024.1 hypothetical protein WV31_10335 [Magnetospirillum sp. ME-1]